MKRIALAFGFACAAVLGIVAVGIVRAQKDPWSTEGNLTVTAEERELLGELDREKYIKARELAQKIIAKNPRSFVATWGMALVHHEEEGNYARSLFHITRAEELLQAQGLDPQWHAKVLKQRAETLGEMDRTAEQITTLDRLARLYPPGTPARKIWPLIKQKRYAEAKALGESLATSEDPNERVTALNGLLTVEEEQRNRETAFQAGKTAVERFPNSCILHRNGGVIAWERFKPQLAEEWLLRGATATDFDCGGSPYADLAWHYLLGGQINQAVEALKKSNTIPVRRKDRAYQGLLRRALLADLVYVLGKVDDAERLAQEVYEQPERVGQTSNSAAFARLTRTLRYWLALDARANLEEERASYRHIGARGPTRAKIAMARWEVRRALFQLSVDKDALITITRPNLSDVHVARWTVGALAEILGPGVLTTAVATARELDKAYPEAAPYLDALSGEIAYRGGDLDEALGFAEKALAGIPTADGLIRWYVMTWQADALWREGEYDRALTAYHEVLQKLPSTVRILDVAIPVEVTHDKSERAEEVADSVTDSPRFKSSSRGFKVHVTTTGKSVTACLTDRNGLQFACGSSEGETAEVLDAFHAAAFSPKVAMTQADLSSLDGSTSSRSADEVLEGLLDKK
ncbi:MAG: tetratricopeptide repeat protein [Myxococcota bacterium]|nr:tetratricopeptide repeat protein [Myxococcota bacterium]